VPEPHEIVFGTIGVVAIVAGFALVAAAASAWWKWRGTRLVVCPESRQIAAVKVGALRVVLTAAHGRTWLRIESCTRWPQEHTCDQRCLRQVVARPRAVP
jgi:hypothetical protein